MTAIVLAGGESTRFGGDKLAAELNGDTVLSTTIATVLPLAVGVIVAGPRLPRGFVGREIPVALIPDDGTPRGPLSALRNVLGHWVSERDDDLAVVVGGDMPRLVPEVLVAMLEVLHQDERAGVVLLAQADGAGRRPVLPMAIRIEPAVRAAREAIESGERSLRSFIDRLALRELPATVWRPLDPAGDTLLDVDTQADLERLRARPSRPGAGLG